ncbi:MAG: CaiB/BaiF CoA transferase family protein [Acidimicrobiia bacterium]
MPEALAGVRVLDLSRVLAGPLCSMMLGDFGADVLKVEVPRHGDDTRSWGPPFAGGESAYFLHVNRNKRSMTLNLKMERGRKILKTLIQNSDVVIENFKLGTLDGWGFDDAWFDGHAPQVVRCTISGYGSTGPLAGKPGYDFIAQAESGLMAITGESEGEPMKLGVAIVDFTVGLMATTATLSALRARDVSGRGQAIEVTLHDTGLQMLAAIASNYLLAGQSAERYGNAHPNIVPYRTFHTSDGVLAIGVGNDAQFRAFCGVLDRPEWVDDDRFASNQGRVRNRGLMEELIQERIMTRTKTDWMTELTRVGIPNGPINSVAEALSSEHTKERGMVIEIEHPTIGAYQALGFPIRMSETPTTVRRPPPLLGQHTDEVLAELGFEDSAIVQLRSGGVV